MTPNPTSTYKVPVFEKERNKDWVRYGEDNLYPQYLCDLFNRSAKHNAILVAKQKYTFGQGIKIKQDVSNSIDAQKLLMRPNKFENMENVFKKLELDKWLYGGYCVQIVWSKASGKIAEFYHMDFAKVRSNVDNTEFYYSENWADYRPKVATFKSFDPEKPEGVQLLYVRDYRPNVSTYPLPDYIGAIPYIECDTDVANFHRANLQNNFFFGGILNFNNGTPTAEEQTELVRRINRRHGSTDNAGRWIINFSDGQDRAPNVITLQPSDLDKQFDILNKTIQEEIFVAHRVTSPMFFGIRVEGQLGGRSEMIDSFKLFEQNEIKPVQNHFEQFFNYIATINGIGQPYEILPLEPFSPELSESALLQIADKDELREMAGLAKVDKPELVEKIEKLPSKFQDKIIESLSVDEIKRAAGIPVQLQLSLEDNWKEEIKVFSEFGDSADNYEEIHRTYLDLFESVEDEEARKHAFNEQLENIEQEY